MNTSNSSTFCLMAVFAAGLAVLAVYSWYQSELSQLKFESHVLSDGSTFWALPNTDFSRGNILPEWILDEIDVELADKFERITELDFCIDDLNHYDPDLTRFYTKFKYVHTIRLSNRYCKREIVEILKSFQNLKTINVEPWGGNQTEGLVELSSDSLPGVQVNYK